MSSTWGKNVNVSIFGESHGQAIGVTINGLPAGFALDMAELQRYMAKRKPGGNLATPRSEDDLPVILSGVFNGKTTGAPLTAVIYNKNTKSGDYENISHCARPGHADYTAYVKYNGANDYRGGGHFSGRLTACIVFAGAVCSQILKSQGIEIFAHISSISDVNDTPFEMVVCDEIKSKLDCDFPVINDLAGQQMKERVKNALEQSDSVGGTVECMATGLPAGIGSPMFDGVENKIASIMFGIPAVKGIEFGAGFESAKMFGSQNNDEFYIDGDVAKTKTNNCGGVLGGITNGMPVTFKVAFKPTPSIAQKQQTIDFKTDQNTTIEVKGRHDPCVVMRATPVVTAATAIAILDLLYEI
ncbi:MAG: chorismate synthase [Clostridia bacterium]|nr:chorismate synthase [Clostridia bacterium]